MCLEFIMIVIRKDAIGVYSVAMLTLRGAWSQLKICADQTACPRRARLSLELLLLLQRDGQAQGLSLPPSRLRRSWLSSARRPPPWVLVRGCSYTPFSCMVWRATDDQAARGGVMRGSLPVHNQLVCERNAAHLFDPHRDPLFPQGNRLSPALPLTLRVRTLH